MRTMRVSLIGLKVSLLGSLLTFGIIGVMASAIMQRAEEALVAELSLRAENYARAAQEALVPRPDPFALHFATHSQLKEAAVASASVLSAEGRILSDTDPARIGDLRTPPSLHGSAGAEALPLPGGGYEITAPISAGDRLIGLVTLKVTRLSLARALGGARHQIFRLAWLAAALNLVGAALLIGWLMRPLPRLAQAAEAVGAGDYDARVEHATRDELGQLAAAFNVMAAGLREREKMRSMFGKFVPPEVVEKLVKEGVPTAGRRCEVTVLLSDIRDFTQLSETLSPEELLAFLNDYFKRMVEIIKRHGGIVDKFMGDGILAVFGAPVALEDHAARAATCALEMHFCLERLNAERKRGGLAPIRFGVALNTGPAVAGMVGSDDKLEYTVVGDTVNTVSRLEGLNSKLGTEILVTEAVYLQTCDLFSYEGIGRIQVRGRKQAVGVFQLLGPGTVAPPAVAKVLDTLETPVPQIPATARRRAAARA